MRYGLVTANKTTVPLKSIHVHVSITGTVAYVVTDFLYENEEEKNPIEAVFVLPLESGISICGFQAEIDGRVVNGRVEEKQDAIDMYDDAISSGQTAFLMEESLDSDDIFKMSVGNLAPKKSAKVTTKAFIRLKYLREGEIHFMLPTVLNPRYSPVGGEGSADFDNWSQSTGICCVSKPYAFSLDADIQCGSEIAEVTSASHQINVSKDGCTARVDVKDIEKHTKDVELIVKQKNPLQPHAFLELGGDEAGNAFLSSALVMVNYFPLDVLPPDIRASPGDYVFVIDRSGSMSGNEIANAKESLLLFLKSLPPASKFNIISFGSRYEFLYSGGSKDYTNENVAHACDVVSKMEADFGGTEILRPLQALFSLKKSSDLQRRVFLITDGGVSNTKEVISAVKKECKATGTRCFALGIGHGASTSLIKGVAEAGNGFAEFAREGGTTQQMVIKLLKVASQPCLSDISLKWNLKNNSVTQQIPSELEQVAFGDSLTVFAVIKGLLPKQDVGAITLKFTVEGQNFSKEIKLDILQASGLRSQTLHSCAAKVLISAQSENNDHKNEVIELSKATSVLSPFTAFIAIDEGNGEPIKGTMLQKRIDTAMDKVELMCMSSMLSHVPFKKKKARKKSKTKYSQIDRLARPIVADCVAGSLPESYENYSLAGRRVEAAPPKKEMEKCVEWKLSSPKSSCSKPQSAHLALVSMQSVDGSWPLSDRLASEFGKQLSSLKSQLPNELKSYANAETIWATCLCVVWLSSGKFHAVQVELTLIIDKARNWLISALTSGQNLSQLQREASTVLGL